MMILIYWIIATIGLGLAARFLSLPFQIFGVLIIYYSIISLARPSSKAAPECVQDHRDIASFVILQNKSLKARLLARAKPNERLKEAFGIDNPFTTTSIATYRRFMQKIGPRLHNTKFEKWSKFSNAATTTLDLILSRVWDARYPLPLVPIARQLVFVSTLNSFFDVDPKNVDLVGVCVVTDLINDLWVRSKIAPRSDPWVVRTLLETALQQLLPGKFPCSTRGNPLNIIIPAYETMWRVVLLTFISAGFRNVDQETAGQFLRVIEGVPECFEDGESRDLRAIAVNFAKEGLRLYPPTKRIYRAVPMGPQSSPFIKYDEVIANIEKCHRDPNIWINPEQFRPSRFLPEEFTDDMKNAYLPFSIAPHRCPAADTFAPNAIIALVVVLAKGLGTLESGSNVWFGDTKLDQDKSALLPSGRLDMDDWKLKIKDTV
ncbi:hypothetical protein F4814DRAFT_84058 [Daldinia grandis]|nr:hypothetical protein F4814DRAFT_84058 [Daldinia grandis]